MDQELKHKNNKLYKHTSHNKCMKIFEVRHKWEKVKKTHTANDTHNRTLLKNKKQDYGYEGTVRCNNLV